MNFDSSSGKLSISLRGQNGENGSAGQDLSGTRARDANFGECTKYKEFIPCGLYDEPGADCSGLRIGFKNSVFAENGLRGGNAGRGYDGGYGGDISFYTKNHQDFVLTAKSEPGTRGKMGKPGNGQKGGLAQPPVDCFGTMVNGLPAGEDGPPGLPSQDGEDGKRGVVNVLLGQVKIENK